jgi:hypothetical protein
MRNAALKAIIRRSFKSMIYEGFVIPNILGYANVNAFTTTNFKRRMGIMAICIVDYSCGFAFTNTTEV